MLALLNINICALWVVIQLSNFVRMSQLSGRHIRSPLVRSVYQRWVDDESHRNDDHHHWYRVDTGRFSPDLCDKFIQFNEDAETSQFLDKCYEKADWLFTQIGHSFAKSILSWFMTSTSINGLLGRGSMFIFSCSQLEQLLGIDLTWRADSMLDLGAGDGMVTSQMSTYFTDVYVTEVSTPMLWRLKEKGYKVLGLDEWSDGNRTYDLISCLNVLDRCDKPVTVLQNIRQSLTPGSGRAIVAIVLPFKPYVEVGPPDHKPTEMLLVGGSTFEEQMTSLIKNVFEPAGLSVERFTRLPYLCEGDLHHSFYFLSDAVFVLKSKVTENG